VVDAYNNSASDHRLRELHQEVDRYDSLRNPRCIQELHNGQINEAFRKRSKELHPDKGGSIEDFHELEEAFHVLRDKDRRDRYDKTGQVQKSRITPDLVEGFVLQAMTQAVMAEVNPMVNDDPTMIDVKQRIIDGMNISRRQLKDSKFKLQRKIERATRMLERFKPKVKTATTLWATPCVRT
jgi:curved DNA-binding protein CbpA